MLRIEKRQKVYDEGYSEGVAAEKEKQENKLTADRERHEAEEARSFIRGEYEGLREACRILDDTIKIEDDDSDDESSIKMYRTLNKARRRIAKLADETYDRTHDRMGKTV